MLHHINILLYNGIEKINIYTTYLKEINALFLLNNFKYISN